MKNGRSMPTSAGELASFLRAHRARVEPASIGLPAGGDRRVPGLRREEVAVSDDLPPGELRRMWSPTAATLIHGETDAVLADPLMTAAEGEDLAGWIAATGKNLTTIFVTHGHGDHFFGAAPVLDRFPDAKMVAVPAVVEGMKKQLSPALYHAMVGEYPDRLNRGVLWNSAQAIKG